jgi:glycine dehydrogenase subunit 1
VNDALAKAGILGGLAVEDGILWCATEKVSREKLDEAVSIVRGACA